MQHVSDRDVLSILLSNFVTEGENRIETKRTLGIPGGKILRDGRAW